MNNFCTLFDSNYLMRGLAMYESLVKHCPDFHLYIFAFDAKAYELLKKIDLKKATVISLGEFEDDKLLAVKPGRTKAEYCWTCTSSSILYCLEKLNLPICTYIDADILFFDNPEILLDELKDRSILLTKHRYPAEHDKSDYSGKYCVQFLTFKNNAEGLKALRWWREACLDWCYARSEDGKFGDQKYLNDWPEKFNGVHVLHNLGGGVAPWNVLSYDFYQKDKEIYGREISSQKEFKIIFFHFHNSALYKIFGKIKSSYFQRVNKKSELLFYRLYDRFLNMAYDLLKAIEPSYKYGLEKNNYPYYLIKSREYAPNILIKIYRKLLYGKKN